MTDDAVEDMQQIYASAIAAHENGDAATAVELYGRILAQFPDADLVLYNQGLALFELDRFREAATVFFKATEIRQDDADTWFNLGLALKEDHRYPEAINAYQRALQLQANDRDILFNLANCCREAEDTEQAANYYEQLLQLEPNHVSALNNFAYTCHLRQDYAQAGQLFQRLLKLRPDHPGALHMSAALSGKAGSTPTNEYVRDLFDQYSDTFEGNLVGKLKYHVPELLFDMLMRCEAERATAEERKLHYAHCLDLGCGTGLAGQLFRPVCASLTGVDLSVKMIDKAAGKGVYDKLIVDDVVRFMQREEQPDEQQYDLLTAADLFTYLADLEAMFLAARTIIRQDGLFVFSTEHGDGLDWQVRTTGRFAHHPDYVVELAERHGWHVICSEQAKLRREADVWVRGDIFVLTAKNA